MATLDPDSAIRSRAYEYWQAEGEQPGRALDHWLKAEAEIRVAPATAAKKPSRSLARKPATRARAKA